MAEISITGLSKAFGDVAVVRDLAVDVRDGEFLTLLGPSGCGKTTTLRTIAGLERADAGQIRLGERTVSDVARRLHLPPERRDVGFVFQSYALWPHMSVRENVAYPLRVRRVGRRAAARAAGEALELVELGSLGDRSPSQLSGGQQQRVALARALVTRPPVMLFDEPLSNLDTELRATLRETLRQVHREVGTTSVYVTHDQEDALRLSDRIAVMSQGRIEQLGAPEQLFAAPGSAFVARFVGFDLVVAGHVRAADGRRARVEVAGWSRPLAATTPQPLRPGQPAQLLLRTAGLRVEPGLDGVGVDGLALEVRFGASGHEVRVRVGDDELIAPLASGAPVPAVGGGVGLLISDAHAVALPRRDALRAADFPIPSSIHPTVSTT